MPASAAAQQTARSVRFVLSLSIPSLSGGAEVGIKEFGIISIFHQSGKGHKRNGAETERGRNGKRHTGKRHNSFCSKPEIGIKEKGTKERGTIQFVQNRKGA
jgi:hypothetical protein